MIHQKQIALALLWHEFAQLKNLKQLNYNIEFATEFQ